MIRRLWKWIFIIFILWFMYLPILILAVYSFTDATKIGAICGFFHHNHATLFTTPELVAHDRGNTWAWNLVSVTLADFLGTIGASVPSTRKRSIVHNRDDQSCDVVNADAPQDFSYAFCWLLVLGISKDTYIPPIAGPGDIVYLCVSFGYSDAEGT